MSAHRIPNERIEPQDLARLLALSQKVNLAKLIEAASLLLSKLVPFSDEQGIADRERTHPEAQQTKVSPFRLRASLQGADQQEIPDEASIRYKPSENVAGAGGTKTIDLSINRNPSVGGRGLGGGGGGTSHDFAGDILFVQDTSIGKIVVGGSGTSYYYADAAVIIDLGGNDYYFNNAGLPENMVLTVVGDVDTNQVLQAVQKEFGKLPKGNFVHPNVVQEPPLQKTRTSEIYKEKEQAHFVLGFLGPTLRSADRYAIEVIDAALSGMGGRLFYELRDKESLAYSLAFIGNVNLDPGYICVYMGTRPDKFEKAIESVLRELKKVKEEGLTSDEVERAKRYLIGNFEIGLQTNGAQANRISVDELYDLGFNYYEKYPDEIKKVTIEDVRRVAKQYLNLDVYALSIIRPPKEKKQ